MAWDTGRKYSLDFFRLHGALRTICHQAVESAASRQQRRGRIRYLHEILIVELDPPIPIGVTPGVNDKVNRRSSFGFAYLWNASVSVFTTTHARTNLSNVIPGGGPYRETGPEPTSRGVVGAGHKDKVDGLTILLLDKR